MEMDSSSLTPSLADYRPGQYVCSAGFGKRAVWYALNAVLFDSWLCPFSSPKTFVLRCFGAKIGTGLVIKPRVNIKYPWNLTIGDHVWIGEGAGIDNLAPVQIGSNVCISQGAMLLTGNHDYKDRKFGLVLGEIHIDEGVWIGARCLVCPGAKCRRNSVLMAGSVLSKEAEANGVYGGNPAKRIRYRVIRG
ncbi:WcaF family extracellular polysaccharide biosynthesis acetyltransferase [Methylocaldum sp.]|uniref:WcaF family extracellular polysaccharide biosynthesis acetyltransferase n=1 Tax=Methylocaldum sp. TaxID=1969727 RepID=UPI002D62BC03|nr:WcaF family extracellular polysaccharide biosynthesis acetyltransferase [Methylocaldum sp.]HYE37382.1 WcaF family extracellular polysaccharide biosynthesis acetyltransferase [Methylocaldum sp.]